MFDAPPCAVFPENALNQFAPAPPKPAGTGEFAPNELVNEAIAVTNDPVTCEPPGEYIVRLAGGVVLFPPPLAPINVIVIDAFENVVFVPSDPFAADPPPAPPVPSVTV